MIEPFFPLQPQHNLTTQNLENPENGARQRAGVHAWTWCLLQCSLPDNDIACARNSVVLWRASPLIGFDGIQGQGL